MPFGSIGSCCCAPPGCTCSHGAAVVIPATDLTLSWKTSIGTTVVTTLVYNPAATPPNWTSAFLEFPGCNPLTSCCWIQFDFTCAGLISFAYASDSSGTPTFDGASCFTVNAGFGGPTGFPTCSGSPFMATIAGSGWFVSGVITP